MKIVQHKMTQSFNVLSNNNNRYQNVNLREILLFFLYLFSVFLFCGKIRLSTTPMVAANPIPAKVKVPI